MFSSVIVGNGSQLIACAEQLLFRGHQINAVVTNCPEVLSWIQKKGIPRIDPSEDIASALNRESFDYLFSIVNHAITPNEVLALPKLGAINYHDSLLPSYSGFNATSWAILDGKIEHGITWHLMTSDVDAGAILLQKPLTIAEHDTAFSLAAKASALAVKSFAELIEGLEGNTTTKLPGQPAQSFHYKSERPGFAVIDWTSKTEEILRLIRALDFGSEDNWMTRAKLETPSGEFLCVGNATLTKSLHSEPGTISQVSADSIEIHAANGVLLLSEITTLEGVQITHQMFSDFGIAAGNELPAYQTSYAHAAQALDREITKSERFWLKKLELLHPSALSELKPHSPTGVLDRVSIALPDAFLSCSPETRQALLVAAFSVYLARVGNEADGINFGLCVDSIPDDLHSLFSFVTPLTIDITSAPAWSELMGQIAQAIDTSIRRKTYARDLWTRYGSVRQVAAENRQLPIALSFLEFKKPKLPAGVRLLLSCSPNTSVFELIFDTGAINKLQSKRLAERLVHLLDQALRNPEVLLSTLSVVTPEEQTLLLSTFQDTHRPNVEMSCIQQLFAAQAGYAGDKTALVCRNEHLTYRELDERSNALARHLQAMGVGPDQLVAVSIERSIHMVVGLLAILKAGGAYVPLDPAYPAERLSIMLEDSGARWLLTQAHLEKQLPKHDARIVLIDAAENYSAEIGPLFTNTTPNNLAYVIFTSGSTGRPKGVMIEHRNVANFFAGMDERVGTEPGVWLAVTSISFDISVLEIFWTLTRGFEVVIQEEGDRASLLKSQGKIKASKRPMGFGLFYFAADSTNAASTNAYRLMLDGARFADTHNFTAVWTPERHFHAFGGLYPNAAVTSAAIATITSNVELRAGSVVIGLHDPIRVAEEWAVVDNLSQGRVGLSFASGWHANDFALKPENYENRNKVMYESIETVLKLWSGEKIKVKNGVGTEVEISVLPRPLREKPPMWIASAGNIETFRSAGRAGYNILTNMLGQDIKVLAANFAAYREARRDSGYDGEGTISVMLHTFVTNDDEKARLLARGPFGNYLKTSYDLVKVAPWMFPAFKQPSTAGSDSSAFDPSRFDESDMEALLDHAFDRYFDTAGLFGTPERSLRLIEQLKDIGATEVACLIDFGIDPDVVLENLIHLDELRRISNPDAFADSSPSDPIPIRQQFERKPITHLQCTPSMARMLIADGTTTAMKSLRKILLGGEALPIDLCEKLAQELPETELLNMYGPTETTVWSTTASIGKNDKTITIGRPIANTQIRILDAALGMVPIGTPGELCIGGAGVVRGYLNRPDLTSERFVADPYNNGNRLYRTGDLARYRDDGMIEYIGRIDQQVKVNGYRIELGEIESILNRHPAVKEAVVSVKDSPAGAQLVGYVIASGNEVMAESSPSNVSDWKQRWDEAYSKRAGASEAPVRFNTSGWLDSYTGEPIPIEQMREWLDQTVERIIALQPRRVLEIGCGTGMILYSCLPHVDHYTALDLSPFALETIRTELDADERKKVTLLNQAAHELDAVADKSCDLVIINSVAQYFPDVDYLVQVLERVSRVLTDGGKIFLGDIRSLEEVQAFHTLVELQKAPGQIDSSALSDRIADRTAMENELLLASSFFDALEKRVPRLSLTSIQLKRGQYANEMRDFRSDVVLQAGPPETKLDLEMAISIDSPTSLDSVAQALATRPPLLLLKNIPNARVSRALGVSACIKIRTGGSTVESLRHLLDDPVVGIDPNMLFDLDPDYAAETRFGQQPGTFNALLRHKTFSPRGVWPAPLTTAAAHASNPYIRLEPDRLIPKLRAHLKDFLPEYMLPQAFMLLEAFPLTPNGKIDRKALPLPAEKLRQAAVEYAIPSNELERKIAEIWQEMLGIERVGRKDNIFDLGASSLLTVEANNRLQNTLGQKVPLVTMFRYPTIESLAAHLSKLMTPAVTGDTATTLVVSAEMDKQNRIAAAAQRRRQARAKNG